MAGLDQHPEHTRGVLAGQAVPAPRASGPRDPCQAPGCERLTNGGKPFCLIHIDLMPYVVAMGRERRRPRGR